MEDEAAPVITRMPVEIKVANYSGQNEELAQIVASYVTAQDEDTIIKMQWQPMEMVTDWMELTCRS